MAHRRHSTRRPRAWIAIWAILVQPLLPIAHHPASLALGQSLAATDHNLCQGSAGAPRDSDHKGPIHKVPTCPICQAVHAIGGFPPPTAVMLKSSFPYAIVVAVVTDNSAPRRLARVAAQPRGPPLPV
jgi:hypothetical protein